jgi:hypothetical protein
MERTPRKAATVQELHSPAIHMSPVTERNIPQIAYDKKKAIKNILKYMLRQDR